MQLEIVFELKDIHHADGRNAVFLEYNVLLIDVDTANDRAEVDPSFGKREAMDHSIGSGCHRYSLILSKID